MFACMFYFTCLNDRWYWMFVFERYNKSIKGMVKNNHWVAESLARNALLQTATRYFDEVNSTSSHALVPWRFVGRHRIVRSVRTHIHITIMYYFDVCLQNECGSAISISCTWCSCSAICSPVQSRASFTCSLPWKRVGSNFVWISRYYRQTR